jgi:hypothetical protein
MTFAKGTRGRCLGLALFLLHAGCLGRVAHEPGGGAGGDGDMGGVTGAPYGGTGTGTPGSGATGVAVVPQAETPGQGVVIVAAGGEDEDGAITADATNVYWTSLDANGAYDLVSCPVSGCADVGQTTLYQGVYASSLAGELVAANGRIYFQVDAGGTIVSCASTGCGGSPSPFAAVSSPTNAGLTTDGTSLYWVDSGEVYSCPLGEGCSGRAHVTTMPHGVLQNLVVGGSSLFWVDLDGQVDSAPASGGAATPLCSVPDAAAGVVGEGSLAVVAGSVYVSTGMQIQGNPGGIYDCPIGGGTATLFRYDPGALFIETDGESVFWLSGNPSAMTQIRTCAPGVTCASPTSFLGPAMHLEGFALEGSYVFSAGEEIQRTAKL